MPETISRWETNYLKGSSIDWKVVNTKSIWHLASLLLWSTFKLMTFWWWCTFLTRVKRLGLLWSKAVSL